jgi:hypothetical protein
VRVRKVTWVAGTIAVLGALVTVFALVGLDKADKIASTIGAVAGLAALAVALASARTPSDLRGSGPESSAPESSAPQGSGPDHGRSARSTPKRRDRDRDDPDRSDPDDGAQTVRDSYVGGHVTQIRNVRGDVRIGPDTPADDR